MDDILALVSDVYCRFVTFPCGILGQVYRFLKSAFFLTYTKRIEVCFSPCIIFAEFCKFVIVYCLYVLLEYTCFNVSDFTKSNNILTAKAIDPSELIAQYNFAYKSKIIVRKAFFDK